MNWQKAIYNLQIDSYVNDYGITVARTGKNRFVVLMDGFVYHVGGGTTSIGMAVARCVETITETPQPYPCARCGKPREISSYCREHYNSIHALNKRKRRQQDIA